MFTELPVGKAVELTVTISAESAGGSTCSVTGEGRVDTGYLGSATYTLSGDIYVKDGELVADLFMEVSWGGVNGFYMMYGPAYFDPTNMEFYHMEGVISPASETTETWTLTAL